MDQGLHTSAMNRLINRLARLPGIGKRSAQRLAFHLLKQPVEEATELAAALTDLKNCVAHCSVCFNLTETDPCPICSDPRRDHSLLLVVEQPDDVAAFENTGSYRGLYHVLMGRISPLDGIGPGELNIASLLARAQGDSEAQPGIREVIVGLSPTLEGDGTAMHLAQELARLGVQTTRLARGLPTGSSLEMVSKAVLTDSIHGRQQMPVD